VQEEASRRRQRSNAITRPAHVSGGLPARCQRELTSPLQVQLQVEETRASAFSPAGAEEGGAMPGDADAAAV